MRLLFDIFSEITYYDLSVVCRNCLAFTFAPLLQKEVDEFVLYWNTHKIRANRLANCPSGIPDDLYDMPAHVGTLLYSNVSMHLF